MDKVRVIRIIIYEGDRDWVERTLIGSISGTRMMDKENAIHVCTIGKFPEIMSSSPRETRYACGDENTPGNFVIFAGPFLTEEEALAVNGESDKSRIIKFDKSGVDTIIYTWGVATSKWVPHKETEH